MIIKSFITATLVGILLYSSSTFCNPASTEYVKTAIDALRNELTTQIKMVGSGVDSVQQ